MNNKAIKMKDKNGNIFYPCPYYPVGSIYETTNSGFKPADVFGGTWTKIYSDYEKIYLGSQRIREDWLNEGGPVSKTHVVGAYDYGIFAGIFENANKIATYKNMSGYDVKVGLTAQISTGGGNHGKIYFNNKLMVDGSTWSGADFRGVPDMKLYKIDDLGKETVQNYTGKGINMYVENTGSAYCYIRAITVHGYLISKKKRYIWERTA